MNATFIRNSKKSGSSADLGLVGTAADVFKDEFFLFCKMLIYYSIQLQCNLSKILI